MRLRCPHNNCPIDVPDDLVGVRIRCPHCGELMFVDRKYAEASSMEIQAGKPAPGKPAANEPANLENQIYDGLPPLSVMMALRRQKGFTYDADLIARYEMTPDDWKALDAFEQVLHASFQVKTALVFCLLGVVTSLIVVGGVMALPPVDELQSGTRTRALGNLAAMVVLGAGLVVTFFAGQSFCSLRLGGWTHALPWGTFGVAVVFGLVAAVNAFTLFKETDASLAGAAILSVPVDFFGAIAAGAACWRVLFALDRVSPPEIHHRLTEAMKYLE